nr:4-hydroxythreonine-4-phosphate dehydrogenase PdxA [Burkholderiales bacterium]
GDAGAVERVIALTRTSLTVRAIEALDQAQFAPRCVDVLDPKTLRPDDITMGKISPACGRAVTKWWEMATDLAQRGKVAAIVKGPVNSEAIEQGGGPAQNAVEPGKTYLFLITGPLRVAHLTDHIPLAQVLHEIKLERILKLLRLMHASLQGWGVAAPRIGVAGFNPHAHGKEEEAEIIPAVMQAQREGITATGPVPADSLFRQCIEGQYDCVLAHYHDQGHIAVKTWGFAGNCALLLGAPYIRLSVAHGTAFDIAGRGIADHASMHEAMRTAASLASGRGFPSPPLKGVLAASQGTR